MGDKMYVYSGQCRQGECGVKSGLKDINGDDLYVGDIVSTIHISNDGRPGYDYGLSCVVSDRWTSYSDGTHVENSDASKYFVMGIANVDFMADDTEWHVKRVKLWSDCVDGEHWPEFGFNYKRAQDGDK